MSKTAVVLFNLGGPDRLESVRPFLFNLFNDRAIIDLPGLPRWLLAQLISRRRAPVACKIYESLGGGSPLLANTEAQARALQATLSDLGGDLRVFIAMRYWHPKSDETAAQVAAYGPDRVVLLPLYPQYSTTTTGSSLAAWERAAKAVGLTAPTRGICCYPSEPGFVAQIAEGLGQTLNELGTETPARVLFSAHGLPKKIVARGDPYQWQVEATAEAVVKALGRPGLDWRVCYQSRVGPLEWIEPATDQEIERAGTEGLALVVVPIAFVSEHSETLVELDQEYGALARKSGVPTYLRVATVKEGASFIEGLAGLVRATLAEDRPLRSQDGGRLCPERWGRCLNC
jgi:ferrochelatase